MHLVAGKRDDPQRLAEHPQPGDAGDALANPGGDGHHRRERLPGRATRRVPATAAHACADSAPRPPAGLTQPPCLVARRFQSM